MRELLSLSRSIIQCHQTALHLTAVSETAIPRAQGEDLLQRRAGSSLCLHLQFPVVMQGCLISQAEAGEPVRAPLGYASLGSQSLIYLEEELGPQFPPH